MRNHATKLSCALVLLALTACSSPAETPVANSTQLSKTALPSAEPSSAKPLDGSPATFRYEKSQLVQALPTTYRGRAMDPFTYLIDLRSYSMRDDPFAGQSVTPESCRLAVQSAGRLIEGIDGFRTDTPAVMATATTTTPAGQGTANVRLYELTGAEAVRYQAQSLRAAPECREFTIGSSGDGSIVERSLPEFGSTSRYVVRTYPRSGRTWIERSLLLQTKRAALEVRVFDLNNTERDFLAFARQVRTRALRTLG
jgi:hypothetical protein